MKILRSRAQLADTVGWVEGFSTSSAKVIGLLDALVGLGLDLPGATGTAPILVPVAALGGITLAGGGSVVHLRRSETSLAAANLAYTALLVVVARGCFGPYRL
ncbi:hypothetical protein AQJ23_00620 [Streptomyces antibioticus]|nr:DoxX family protein [Streptomyces antibioticus]KUN29325.1 hypothetical protein AQJ23_00620 [Streptomyces antibioticus]